MAIRQWVAPRVLGRDFPGPEAVHAALEHDFRGHRMAKAAVEMGAWELAAQQKGVALAKLLDEPRGSFDIGKEEGDYTARQICHAAQA